MINTGRECVVFTQTSEPLVTSLIDSCEILFTEDVVLTEGNKKVRMIIVKKDEPSELISKMVDVSIRPADRAFIHTVNGKFTQTQKILVGFISDEQDKEVELFPCMVIDIIPNGYLK